MQKVRLRASTTAKIKQKLGYHGRIYHGIGQKLCDGQGSAMKMNGMMPKCYYAWNECSFGSEFESQAAVKCLISNWRLLSNWKVFQIWDHVHIIQGWIPREVQTFSASSWKPGWLKNALLEPADLTIKPFSCIENASTNWKSGYTSLQSIEDIQSKQSRM